MYTNFSKIHVLITILLISSPTLSGASGLKDLSRVGEEYLKIFERLENSSEQVLARKIVLYKNTLKEQVSLTKTIASNPEVFGLTSNEFKKKNYLVLEYGNLLNHLEQCWRLARFSEFPTVEIDLYSVLNQMNSGFLDAVSAIGFYSEKIDLENLARYVLLTEAFQNALMIVFDINIDWRRTLICVDLKGLLEEYHTRYLATLIPNDELLKTLNEAGLFLEFLRINTRMTKLIEETPQLMKVLHTKNIASDDLRTGLAEAYFDYIMFFFHMAN